MIYISSRAGQRLAKAKAKQDRASALFQISETQGDWYAYLTARERFFDAATAAANELIADRHHEMEDGQ